MGVFLLFPFPLVRYQPSGSSIILDPIFLKTVKLLLSLSLSLNPQSKFSCRPYSSFFYCTGLDGQVEDFLCPSLSASNKFTQLVIVTLRNMSITYEQTFTRSPI